MKVQKCLITFLLCFILIQAFGQSHEKVSIYLGGQYNKTLYDITKGNNPWGIGLGLQSFLNVASKFKTTVEVTADLYLEDDKVLRLNPDNTPIEAIRSIINLFAGASYHPTKKIYLSLVTGSSFISGETYLGIKPSIGFFVTPTQKWTSKVSYTNIFNRDKRINKDFGAVSLTIAVKLF